MECVSYTIYLIKFNNGRIRTKCEMWCVFFSITFLNLSFLIHYLRVSHFVKSIRTFGVFLVRIFLHSDWIRRDTPYFSSIFSRMWENADQKNSEYQHFSHSVHCWHWTCKCLLAIVSSLNLPATAWKMKFSIKDFFSKYDQIRRKLCGASKGSIKRPFRPS